jgi:hypothetical protein
MKRPLIVCHFEELGATLAHLLDATIRKAGRMRDR